ncbi:MAG TPA: FliH/SctL family protein [Bryobacteraceae bacterium]|nr:FliH/SctL family protein [Bryobacteraceae bacterium]
MSSKVLPPDDPQPVTPMPWRIIESATRPGAAAVSPSGAKTSYSEPSGLDHGIQEAHAAGVREGEAAGRNRAAAELQPVIERLSRSIQEIAGMRARMRREAETDLLRLATAIARRILRREIAIDPDAMHGLVLGALEKLQSQEIARVRVHPAHAPLLSACLRQMVATSPVEVVPDPSREPGTVIFETERGNLDASVESQLREIERGLADRLATQR